MTAESNQINRITYEAFSKFSNNLNRCRTFEEITECFTINLKYLFNYHVFRASYNRNGVYVHLLSTSGNTTLTICDKPYYLEYEELLLNETIPQLWRDVSVLRLPESFVSIQEESPELWGWNFINDEKQLIVSLLSGSRKKFGRKDIHFLRLVSDNLETKLLEFLLTKELDEKNDIISKINEKQKEVIKERTREIADKNKTLLQISALNAHNVREPLSRIIGLVNLLGEGETEELTREIVPLIKASSNELDLALRNVINHATRDLSALKA